jgi:hypothetical protein
MSTYRPICDVWILARSKVPYYGAYPNGFLERARVLLGVSPIDTMLHVCGGRAKDYPAWSKLCPRDKTLDLDERTQPDFLQDARLPLPKTPAFHDWDAILCDPPYTVKDAEQYAVHVTLMPTPNALLRNALAAVRPHGRVGMLHYILPQPPREGVKFLACVGVIVGFNNRMRVFSVFERLS